MTGFIDATKVTAATVTMTTGEAGDRFGDNRLLADVNGDGTLDVIGRDSNDAVNGVYSAGSVWVRSGVDGADLLTIAGDDASDRIGSHGVRLIDLDGDGATEVIVLSRQRRCRRGDGRGQRARVLGRERDGAVRRHGR